jgi:SAM-dependent methyltransferase
MQQFWDERAKEDAFYFVDNRIGYRDPQAEAQFWGEGVKDLDVLLSVAEIEVKPTDRVVEIGCGVGRLTRVLAERAGSVKALDVSSAMLEQAREHNGHLTNVEWVHGDGVSLAGIADGEADLVVSHVVFQHIPEPAITLGYLREMGRVLRPGGLAGFQVSNNKAVHRGRSGFGERVRAALGRAPKGQTHAAWLGSAVEVDELRAAAADGGMDVEKLVGEGTQYMLVRLHRL